MSKRFVGIWRDGSSLRVEIERTLTGVLQKDNGLIGALVPATPHTPVASLDGVAAVIFLVPRSPSKLLAVLVNDLGDELRDSCYVTHGHAAAVLLLRDRKDWDRVLDSVDHLLRGFEYWPLEAGIISESEIEVRAPTLESSLAVTEIDCEGLGFEAAAQVRQFNANLSLLARIVASYASEVWPLIESLRDQVAQIVDGLKQEGTGGHTGRISSQTVLIETNAVVTLYCSQLGSGMLPLHRSLFPVGEYSLLGIGSMCRAAWRLYEHLNRTFAEYDHPSVVRAQYSALPPFDPFGPSSCRQDFSTWKQANFAMHQLPKPAVLEAPRYHVPYFSSRWGFHESLHAISLSWQCLHASATKEWNLLTVTHEFLHAQVRAIFGELLRPSADESDLAERIVQRYNARESGTNARESMQVAIAEAAVVYSSAVGLARTVSGTITSQQHSSVASTISASELHELVREHSGIIHEITVHVLDFRYVYAGRDLEYIHSIWCSWSLVPGVADKIEHYVLRTLCALSAVSELDASASNTELFEEAVSRLRLVLQELCSEDGAWPALADALDVLGNSNAQLRMSIQFATLRYVVELAQSFFYDHRLNTALMADNQTDEDEDSGRFVYGITPGQYLGGDVESPVAFLLDRFAHYSDHAGSDQAEFDSIWQMLQLI